MKIKRPLVIASCALAALVFWPWLGSPIAYVHWKDRFRTSIPVAIAFGAPCETKYEGYSAFDPGPDCYRFDEKRRFSGVWRNEFEGSSFFEGRTSLPLDNRQRQEAWLDFSKEASANEAFDTLPKKGTSVVQIEFEGRKTSVPGSHGHFGMYRHLILVDRVLSIRIIEPANGS